MKITEVTTEKAGKTAIARKSISVPTKLLIKMGLISGSVFHHGRGKADADANAMRELGTSYDEYDPNYAPDEEPLSRMYDTTISNYVLNTLPPDLRDHVWGQIRYSVGKGLGYITVRGIGDNSSLKGIEEYQDGLIMRGGTFQKFYSVEEFMEEAGKYFNTVKLIKGTNKMMGITIAVSNADGEGDGDGEVVSESNDPLGLKANATEDAGKAPKLSQADVHELKQRIAKMPRESTNTSFTWNRENLNVVTGQTAGHGTNKMYHTIYTNMPREISNEIAKKLGVKVSVSEKKISTAKPIHKFKQIHTGVLVSTTIQEYIDLREMKNRSGLRESITEELTETMKCYTDELETARVIANHFLAGDSNDMIGVSKIKYNTIRESAQKLETLLVEYLVAPERMNGESVNKLVQFGRAVNGMLKSDSSW